MARIFLSHSSANNAAVAALKTWLSENGWDDAFLDNDPERGLVPGDRWESELRNAAHRCEAVIFLVSDAWLKSQWCRDEFNLSRHLNKRLFGVLIEDIPIDRLPANMTREWQTANLALGHERTRFSVPLPPDQKHQEVDFSTDGLSLLKAGLEKARLNAATFKWPPDHAPDSPPYRGLRPMETDDAGIYFGRDAQIVQALDMLRGLQQAMQPSLMVILGASGAGKSSFLRAGILPRLARDHRLFIPLPIIRPRKAAISGDVGLVQSLQTALSRAGIKCTRAEVRTAVNNGAHHVGLLLGRIAEQARPSATDGEPQRGAVSLILPIDQGEELFSGPDNAESGRLLELLCIFCKDRPNLIGLMTIRSDAFEHLQVNPAREGVRIIPFELPPLPIGAYKEVIEGPAQRLRGAQKLRIEPELTDVLLRDIAAGSAKDALPLLAFTLERLFLEFGGDGDLTAAEYRSLGGLSGSIEAAAERALTEADERHGMPSDRMEKLKLLRRAFVPWLAGINTYHGEPELRAAALADIPDEARPLIELFVDQHLLIKDVRKSDGAVTIEPAHESLLRQWGPIANWLDDDRGSLVVLEAVARAAREWAVHNHSASWLVHRGTRLREILELQERGDLTVKLGSVERQYLERCRAAEDAEKATQQEQQRRLRQAVTQAYALTNARDRAEELTRDASATGVTTRVVQKSLIPRDDLATAPRVTASTIFRHHQREVRSVAFSRDGNLIATASADRIAQVWNPITGIVHATLRGHEDVIPCVSFSRDCATLVTGSADGTARVWDTRTGKQLLVLSGHEREVRDAALSPNGTQVATASNDMTGRLWCASSGAEEAVLRGHASILHTIAYSADGNRVVTTSDDGSARIWDAASGEPVVTLIGHAGWVISGVFSPDGSRVLTASYDTSARIWDAYSGREIYRLSGHQGPLGCAFYSPDGSRVISVSPDKTARLWDAETGEAIAVLDAHTDTVHRAAFSADSQLVVTASEDKKGILWNGITGELIAVLEGHDNWLWTVDFHPKMHLLATASWDATVRVWDVSRFTSK